MWAGAAGRIVRSRRHRLLCTRRSDRAHVPDRCAVRGRAVCGRAAPRGTCARGPPSHARLQRRTVRTLAAAQLAGGAGLAATATVGGLLAVSLAGTEAVAGLPQAASIAGTAAAALPLATLMRRRGRRPGLAVGWLLGAVGAALVVVAVVVASLPLLLLGMALSGVAQASADASRHAAADLAAPARRGAAIGTVVFAVAVTTALSPVLADASGALVAPLGLPALAGPFALAVAACAAAAAVLAVALRPDPLVVAGGVATSAAGSTGPVAGAPGRQRRGALRLVLSRPAVRFPMAATAAAHFVMVFLMTPTPVHLAAHHHGLGLVGLAASAHLAGMYAPAPLTGWLVDRWGRVRVVDLGAALLCAAGGIAIVAPPSAPAVVVASVALLGVGWNLAFVAGTALLADSAPAERAAVQGVGDAVMGAAGILGALVSGVVFGVGGYVALGAVTIAVAAPVLIAVLRRR